MSHKTSEFVNRRTSRGSSLFATLLGFMLMNLLATAPVTSYAAVRKSVGTTKVKASKAVARVPSNRPQVFIEKRAEKILAALKSRPVRTGARVGGMRGVVAEPGKSSWLQAVYNQNMVDTSWATAMLADKRLFAEVLKQAIGGQAEKYYPKTLGLREFLVKYHLVDRRGRLVKDGDLIENALYDEFPAGFVVRPAVGVAPQEKGRGLFADSDQFVVELLKADNILYQASHLKKPVVSHILDQVASGEAVVLQEDVVGRADVMRKLKSRYFQEVRVHSYENRVVEGAIPERWVQTNLLNEDQSRAAEIFAGEFLRLLPIALLTHQAWGLDVAVMDNGAMRVIDVVTNRGRPSPWSSYLDQPRVIAAYSWHFEKYSSVSFEGWHGFLIRHGFANYVPFWQLKVERARPGLDTARAMVPPLPYFESQ